MSISFALLMAVAYFTKCTTIDTWILTNYHLNFLQDLCSFEGEPIFNQGMGQTRLWQSKETWLWLTNLNVMSLLTPMFLPSGLDGTSSLSVIFHCLFVSCARWNITTKNSLSEKWTALNKYAPLKFSMIVTF